MSDIDIAIATFMGVYSIIGTCFVAATEVRARSVGRSFCEGTLWEAAGSVFVAFLLWPYFVWVVLTDAES